jgi:cobaltochelatase CobT
MGRPPNPGRLCDLLHVVYKSADDERASTDGWDFHEMLRPDLPKENVDGEAIEWAVLRMRAWPKKNKVLLVISDGAPVDDSTIQANSAGYLPQHLRAVIADLIAVGDVKICALGLAHDVQEYYPIFERVEMPDDLPRAICSLFQRVIFSDSDDPQTAVV